MAGISWVFSGDTNKSMGEVLFIGSGITQKYLYHQKCDPTLVLPHKSCILKALCSAHKQLNMSKDALSSAQRVNLKLQWFFTAPKAEEEIWKVLQV